MLQQTQGSTGSMSTRNDSMTAKGTVGKTGAGPGRWLQILCSFQNKHIL